MEALTPPSLQRTGRFRTLAFGALVLTGCPGGDGLSIIELAKVASVLLNPPATTVAVGLTTTFTATLRDANGAVLTGRSITWRTSDPLIAAISTSGVLTALTPGTVSISATSEGKTGTATVNVTPGPVATVTVTPAPVSLLIGQTRQLTATAKDDHGNQVSGRPTTWASSAAATVSTTGVVTAVAAGSTVITATTDGIVGSATVTVTAPPPQDLEIHQINVGWGSSVLIRGPNGKTILMEAGNTGQGTAVSVVPYLMSIGIQPGQGLSYTIAGHQHCDHVGGMDEVIQAGYAVQIKNYFNGSPNSNSCTDQWLAVSATTAGGSEVVPAVGSVLDLGSGATLTFVVVNGDVIGGGHVNVSDENDRSIAALVKYGGFDYLWASDLGGGDADNACTGRSTSQKDVETSLIQAISPAGAAPRITAGGIDVLYVNHHGSESSTNSTYMNLARPALAIIGTGDGQAGFELPRRAVVEKVLLAQALCVTAPPALVLQTEEGKPTGVETSFAGYSVGDIKISTDGLTGFTVSANGRVTEGPDERIPAGLPRTLPFDNPSPAPVALARRLRSPFVLPRQSNGALLRRALR